MKSTNSSSVSRSRGSRVHELTLCHYVGEVALPVDIHAPEAFYDTQFGIISRPTHRNTKRDQAMFEVVAHRYADLSEHGYGVSAVCYCRELYADARLN